MKRFTDNTLLGDILGITHDSVTQHNYADLGILDQLSRLGEEAFQRTSLMRTKGKHGDDDAYESSRKRFETITSTLDGMHNDAQLNELSRALALNTIVVNAVSSAQRAKTTTDPETQITGYLTTYFAQAENKQQAVADLKNGLDDLVLSFVHTAHPTVFHSPEARRFEKELSGLLESDYVKAEKRGGPLRLMQGHNIVTDTINAFVEKLVSGKAVITPNPKHPVTVTLETQIEKENYTVIRKELAEVVAAWNAAVEKVPGLDEAGHAALHIDEARKKKLFEMRTWGQSADADGREKATSQLLHDCVQNNFAADGTYQGEIMDMRQNAKVHLDFISALIQVKHRNADPHINGTEKTTSRRYGEDVPNETTGKTFDKFIEDFMREREQTRRMYADPENKAKTYLVYSDPKINWRGHNNSLFQQLQRNDDAEKGDVFDDRADFVSALIKNNYKLVPEQLHTDVHELTDKLYRLKEAFLGKHEEYITAAGYTPKTITYDEMINVSIPGKDGMVSLRGAWDYIAKRNGVELLHGGLQYNRYFDSDSSKHKDELMLDFADDPNVDQQILMQNYLQGTRRVKKDKEGYNTLAPLTTEDRATLMDTIKRMVVASEAIDKATEANSSLPVATRYQIANFSEPADFLIALKLFQEAGLVEVQKGTGEVTKTKMGVMPLLETGEDLEKAGVIFTQLMDDPASKDITRSYYKARGQQLHEDAQRGKPDGEKTEWNGRGQAEIMLGFSDGAATTGNYASQWKIYQAARELTELFDKNGIDVRFFQGRGRGVDRGGTIDPRLQLDLMPSEAAKSGIYDVTIQSDLPMDLAASETYGKDYFTKAFLGTLDATLKGRAMTDAERERMKGYEGGIDWIATRAREVYNNEVRNNEEALAFLDPKSVPNNPTTTSRRAARKDNPTFDEIRAIPKEYYANGADLPMHNVGLGQAINQFVNLWDKSGNWVGDATTREEIVITNREGQKVTGVEAFKALSEHPFHDAMMQTVTASMQHYDPVIAKAYGEITKSESFVGNVMTHLNMLGECLNRYTEAGLTYNPSWASALDHIAHGIIFSGIKNGKPIKPNFNLDDERDWGETLYNSLFVTSQEIGHRQLPGQEKEQQVAMAV